MSLAQRLADLLTNSTESTKRFKRFELLGKYFVVSTHPEKALIRKDFVKKVIISVRDSDVQVKLLLEDETEYTFKIQFVLFATHLVGDITDQTFSRIRFPDLCKTAVSIILSTNKD